MSMQQSHFGNLPDGRAVDLYTLRNRSGLMLKAITYGGRMIELNTPDRAGRLANITLGFERLEDYLQDELYFGPIIGRYALRIAGGRFTMDGVDYRLPTNEGNNTLHSGPGGFDKRLWTADPMETPAGDMLRLTYFSPHMEQGFQGDLMTTVTYTLTDQNELRIDYAAQTDRPTPVSFTHHIYLNLGGVGAGAILDHVAMIAADQYLPTTQDDVPTGQVTTVHSTELDFTTPWRIGDRIGRGRATVDGGYDHWYVLHGGALHRAARVEHPPSGRALELLTDWPGLQFYTGNKLDGRIHGIGGAYRKHAAFTLEPMAYPDAMNHPEFPSPILQPGQRLYRSVVYRFATV